jgi:hypothetical protein
MTGRKLRPTPPSTTKKGSSEDDPLVIPEQRSVPRPRPAVKHRLIPLTETAPKILLQRRRHRWIPEPRMPARIRPQSAANIALRCRHAIAITLLRRFTVGRRRCINHNRPWMRASGQSNWQKDERQTQDLLHHESFRVAWALRKSLGKGIRHRPYAALHERIAQVMAARFLSHWAGTCLKQVAQGENRTAFPDLLFQTRPIALGCAVPSEIC